MSGYQRFLPQDGTRAAAHPRAEAAEPAEVEAGQWLPAAEALLKSAEVRSRDAALQRASARIQHQQSHGIPKLQQAQQLQQAPGPRIAEKQDMDAGSQTQLSRAGQQGGEARTGIPTEWLAGIARLHASPRPRTYPTQAWQQLIVDAEGFLNGWAQQSAALGWPDWELFGCHRQAPWGRIQGMGLVLLLHGDQIAALTTSEAVIRRASGAHQTWRRRPADPLLPADRCLVWELA